MRDLDPTNQLTFLRVASIKHEVRNDLMESKVKSHLDFGSWMHLCFFEKTLIFSEFLIDLLSVLFASQVLVAPEKAFVLIVLQSKREEEE